MRKRVLGNVVKRRIRCDGWESSASYTSAMVNVVEKKKRSEKMENTNAKIFTCTMLV